MDRLDLSTLSVPDAQLLQRGLAATGHYDGTFLGLPGPKTRAAYEQYRGALAPSMIEGERGDIPELLATILAAEIGVREIPRNSNRGLRVEEYQAASWLEGTGWPWCAAFIGWGLLKVAETVALPFERPQTAGAWDYERWAREQSGKGVTIHKPRKSIKRGDIVVFTFSHIGLAIADEKNGYVSTVEGNTDLNGSREGGGVYRRHRPTSLVRSNIRLSA